MQSTSHMLHFHSTTANATGCKINLKISIKSVDIAPKTTITIDRSANIINTESICSHIRNYSQNRVCKIKLTTPKNYLNVTTHLDFLGQSAPRCHQFAVSVFDHGQTVTFFNYTTDEDNTFLYKSNQQLPSVTFNEHNIPLTEHSNPIFLRHETCEPRSQRYVSTTNTVILAVFLDTSYVDWKDINLQVVAHETTCQAFTQFPLQHRFRKRLVESNTVVSDPLVSLDDIDIDFDMFASRMLSASDDTSLMYGIGIYLRKAQVTYLAHTHEDGEFLVVVRKQRAHCFVYQYIHDIYYNNWRDRTDYYISLSIYEEDHNNNKLSSGLISLYFYRSPIYIWRDNTADQHENISDILIHLQSNTIHRMRWTHFKLHRQYLIEATCFSQTEQCENFSAWYGNTTKTQIPWNNIPSHDIKTMLYCYKHGSVHLTGCKNNRTYVHLMTGNTVNCLKIFIAPKVDIHYWFIIPLNNRVILMSYNNQCIPTLYSDKVWFTKIYPDVTTLSWDVLPNIEIGYFGNPLFESPLIIDINRTMHSVKAKQLCSVDVEVSSAASISMYDRWNLVDDTYIIMNATGPMSWNQAEEACHDLGLEMIELSNDASEKIFLSVLLEKKIMSLPVAIFMAPTITKVSPS